MEGVLPGWATSLRSTNSKLLYRRVRLGVRVSSLPRLEMMQLLNGVGVSSYKNDLIDNLFPQSCVDILFTVYIWRNIGSCLLQTPSAKYLLAHRKGNVSVILHKDSATADMLKSYIHAIVLANLMERSTSFYSEGEAWMDKHYEEFLHKLRSGGWKTERLLSPSITWRANWISRSSGSKID